MSAVADTHVPPQNIEAEESVLGAMLVNKPALEVVLDDVQLAPADFYSDRHRALFACACDLHAAGKPVNAISVADALTPTQTEVVEAPGVPAKHYVSELEAKVAAPGSAKHNAEIIRRDARTREVIESAQKTIEAAHNGSLNGEVPALAEKLQALSSDATATLVRTADLSRVRPIRWAWNGRLLLGYLNLLLGAEGVGKGTLTAWLIAQLTCGGLPGDLAGEPSRVLVLGDEDAFDSVWVPRLFAAGADISMVDTLEDEFDLAGGTGPLRNLIQRGSYKVVFFDQLLDNLGDVDDWRSKEVRDRLRA